MQGISVYSRDGRPCWYVAYDCPIRGKRVCKSSGHRLNDSRGKVNAYAYARDKSQSGIAHGAIKDVSAWDNWVAAWLRDHFRNPSQVRTLDSYLGAWKQLSFFLKENKIYTPAMLTYQHCVAFVHWREKQVKKSSGKRVSRNTALHNTKVLSRIMREANRRTYVKGNPCSKLSDDVPPDPVPEKPEYTDDDIATVRRELERRAKVGRPAEWMSIAFEIALHQGVRLSATKIPLADIDLVRDTIKLREKGAHGKPTIFTMPIAPALRPLLTRLKSAKGRRYTCELPRFAARNFGRVLRSLKLPVPDGMYHHTFHSTRVTVITRGARADVNAQKMMAFVHHGNWAVQKIYTRLRPADVAGVFEKVAIPAPSISLPAFSAPARGSDSAQTPDDRRAIARRAKWSTAAR